MTKRCNKKGSPDKKKTTSKSDSLDSVNSYFLYIISTVDQLRQNGVSKRKEKELYSLSQTLL